MSVDVLVLSLLLVLAAAGVLVASVLAGEPQWAWISVACSGLAGVLLLVERFRRRRTSSSGARPRHALTRRARRSAKKEKSGAASEASTATMAPVTSEELADGSAEAGVSTDQLEESAAVSGDTGASETAAAGPGAAATDTSTLPASDSAEPAEPDSPATEAESAEPDEEQTDAADVALVSEAEDQVVVIDERPRYHLITCAWLGSRRTIPLPVREARELGFSPCALCEPDATLVQQLRGA